MQDYLSYVDPFAFDHYVDFCLQSFLVHFLLLIIVYETLPRMTSTAWHGTGRIFLSLLQLGAVLMVQGVKLDQMGVLIFFVATKEMVSVI
jgi:hypothetical protein